MKVTVPFVYEARIQASNTSGLSRVIVPDSVEVDIQELSSEQCPVAFISCNDELRYNNENLMVKRMVLFPDGSYRPTELQETVQIIEGDFAYPLYARVSLSPFSDYWSPFSNIWQAHSKDDAEFGDCPFSELPAKDDIKFTHWHADSREQCIAALKAKAARLFFVDGVLHEKTEEPCYAVVFKYLNKEHTHAVVNMYPTRMSRSSSVSSKNAIFNANEYDAAVNYTENLKAKYPLSSDDIPRENKTELEPNKIFKVLMPEAVTIHPFNLKRHLGEEDE